MTLTDKLQSSPPSRELDAEIATLVGLRPTPEDHPFAALGGCIDENGHGVALPPYTTSIDAALTLLPDGWRVNLSEWDHEALRDRGPWQCVLSPAGAGHFDFNTVQETRCDNAPTPALALCIAILKARAE